MKYLAIDYGEERTGIAISDAGGKMAFALTALNRRQLRTKEHFFNALLKIIDDEAPELIVVGMPLSTFTVKPSVPGFVAIANRPAEISGEVPGEVSGEMPGEIPGEIPGELPGELPIDIPAELPGETRIEPGGETRGVESLTCRKIWNFVKRLKRRIDLPVYTVNEAYSSYEAETRLRQAGFKDKALLEKLDAEAAAVILETFINLPPEQRAEDVRRQTRE